MLELRAGLYGMIIWHQVMVRPRGRRLRPSSPVCPILYLSMEVISRPAQGSEREMRDMETESGVDTEGTTKIDSSNWLRM